MSLTVQNGSLIEVDIQDKAVVRFDWDTDNLDVGVAIATSTFSIRSISPQPVDVVSMVRSGSTVTVITATPHGFLAGDLLSIAGADQVEYDATFTVATVVDTLTFTFTIASTPTSPATGTIVVSMGLGSDNATLLPASPYNSRYTQIRLLGGGARGLGRTFEVSNTIVTNETPAQTKDRFVRVLVADL